MSDFFSQHKLKFLSGLGVIGVGSTAASCVALNGSKEVEQVLEPEVQPELVVETAVKEPIINVEEERPVELQAPEVDEHNAPAEVQTVPEEPPEQLDVAELVEAETTTAKTLEKPSVRNPIPVQEPVKAPEPAVEVKEVKPVAQVEEKVEPKVPALKSEPSEQKMPPPPQITPVTRVLNPRMVAEIDRLSKVLPRGAVAASASANVSYKPITTASVNWGSADLGWGNVDLATYPVNSVADILKTNNYLLGSNASSDLWKSRAIAAWNQLYHLTDEELDVYDNGFKLFALSMRRNWQNHEKYASSWGSRLQGTCAASYYAVNASPALWNAIYDLCRTPDAPNVLYTNKQ